MVFTNKKLAYRPALEDLRLKYYRALKKFLVWFIICKLYATFLFLIYISFHHPINYLLSVDLLYLFINRIFPSHSKGLEMAALCMKSFPIATRRVILIRYILIAVHVTFCYCIISSVSGLLLVYDNAEILFDQLASTLKKYEYWVCTCESSVCFILYLTLLFALFCTLRFC
jgi:hypothetical protein